MLLCEAVLLEWADRIVMADYFSKYLQEAIDRNQPDDDPPLWRLMAPFVLLDDGA